MIEMPIHLNDAWGAVWKAANPGYFSNGPWWNYAAQRRCDGLKLFSVEKVGTHVLVTRGQLPTNPRGEWFPDKEAPSEAMRRIDQEHHVIAIDAMLRRPWHEHEFEEDEKGDRPAGRTYDVSKLALQDWRYLEDIYTRAGWKVGRCGGSNESYMTPAADQRRFLVFCPADRVRQRL